MTKRRLSCRCLVFMMLLAFAGCQTAGSGVQDLLDDSPPVIRHAQSGKIVDDKYIATSSFQIGDTVNFVISVDSAGQDILMVHLKEYYPDSMNQDHTEFKPIEAVPRSKKSKSVMLKEPIQFVGPPGERKFEIQVEDEANHFSNIYNLHLIIH